MTHAEKLALAQKMIEFELSTLDTKIKVLHGLRALPEDKYTEAEHKALETLMRGSR